MILYRSFLALAVCAAAAMAQDVISAKSGLIHYTEGVVKLDGADVVRKNSEFASMKLGSELRTAEGRAEVLLSPGVFLRVAEDSAFRLVKNDLLDTRVDLLAGSILLEVGEAEKNQSLAVMVGDTKLELSRKGLFRINFEPAQLRVHDGSAVVVAGDQTVTVKEGRLTALNGVIAPVKFDKESGDAFVRWASRRSGYIAAANLTAAKRVYDRGGSFGRGFSSGYSNWLFNPYFGMFTYVPLNGLYHNPFGYRFYSPSSVAGVYYRPVFPAPSVGGWGGPSYGGGGMSRGMGDMGGRGSMGGYSSGSVMSAPPASGAPAAPAADGRGVSSGGGRGSGGGR